MSLSVTNVGGNPQQPSLQADAFIPDQLIAGNMKLVTDSVTIKSGANLVRGTVLGQITMASATSAAKAGGNTGTGTLVMDGSAPVQAFALPGVYTVRCVAAVTDKGTFEVKDPKGLVIEAELYSSLGGTTFSDRVKFAITTITGHDYIVGDGFDITIAAGSYKYQKAVTTAIDGSAAPVAILADDAAAASTDVTAGIYLMGQFNSNALTYDGSFTVASLTPLLRPFGIFLKSAVSASDPT